MIALEQVRRWSATGPAAVASRLDVVVQVLADVAGVLVRSWPPGSWTGAAARAAREEHDRLAGQLITLGGEVAAVRSWLVAAADAVTGLHTGLAAADGLADGNGFVIAPDGSVVGDVLPGDGVRGAVRAEIADRFGQVLRAAAALDDELAAALGTVSTGPVGVLAPPDGVGVAAGAGWWAALSPAARQRAVAEHPEWVGNRDGIPAVARDEANERLLTGRAARLDADLRAVRARYDALTAAGPGPVEVAWLAARDDLLGELAELRRRRDVVDVVAGAAAGDDRRLVLLDLERARPRAAVAVGDVDAADHVAVLTPGFGTTVGDDLPGVVTTVAGVRDRSAALLEGSGSVATVAWLGYDAPGVLGVSTADAARRGGADLARFLDGVDAARGADPHLTALGHSYGSLTTGYALQQAHGVDDAVLFGSPGIGTDDVGDLAVPAGHVGVVEAPWDPVADLGWFGDDPNRLDGVTGLSARGATLPDGTATAGSVLHSQYLTPGTTSADNIAATVAGLSGQRILDPGLGIGDVVREGLDRWSR